MIVALKNRTLSPVAKAFIKHAREVASVPALVAQAGAARGRTAPAGIALPPELTQ